MIWVICAVLGLVLGTVVYRQVKGGPYWVQYIDMAYDGGTYSWVSEYKCRLLAVVDKWWIQHLGSWGGTTMMTNYDPRIQQVNREARKQGL